MSIELKKELLEEFKKGIIESKGHKINFVHDFIRDTWERNTELREKNKKEKSYKEVTFTKGQIEKQIKDLSDLLFDSNYKQEKVEKDLTYLLHLLDMFNKGEVFTNINYINRESRRKMAKKKN